MKMKSNIYVRRYLTSLSLVICQLSFGFAQQGESAYRYDDATQLWRLSDNAAALQMDSSRNRGMAELQLEHRDGDYRRVQEGGQRNLLAFNTERYQNVGKYLAGYGRFSFNMDRTKDRAWADVYRPYNATPYYPGSDVAGKYDQQSFAFTGALGSVPVGHFRFGARLDYEVGDLSRLRDPRSRSELLDYRIVPSVAYTTGHHTFALAPYYQRRKEKLVGITTVQNDPNLAYYEMRGLEQTFGSVGAYKGFARQWVDHRLGGSLSYGYRSGSLTSLTSLYMDYGSEDALEDEKKRPGSYTSLHYALASRHRIAADGLLHAIDLQMSLDQGYGDELKQQRVQTTDDQTGYSSYHYETLITYKKRYQQRRFAASVGYRLNFTQEQTVTSYAGLLFDCELHHQKQLLPTSTFDRQRFGLTAEGGKSMLGGRLWADLSAGYHFTGTDDSDLQLAEPGSAYAQQVLLPDMVYYTANYWQARATVKYLFPVTVKQVSTTCYVKAYADYLRSNNNLDQKVVGICIGVEN